MTNTLPLILLLFSALACGKFGPDTTSSTSNNSSNSNAEKPKLQQVVDLPATIGKTKDEIKKMVNGTPKSEDPWLEYTLETAELTFMFDSKTKKASDSTLSFKAISFGNASILGTDTAEQLGTMAGIDVKGKTPKSVSALADTYEIEVGGKKSEADFYKLQGKFQKIMIHAR